MAKIPYHLVYNGFGNIPYISKSILKNYYEISYINTILSDNCADKLDLLNCNFRENDSKLSIGDVVCVNYDEIHTYYIIMHPITEFDLI